VIFTLLVSECCASFIEAAAKDGIFFDTDTRASWSFFGKVFVCDAHEIV
jgi:hypothetical protein